MPDKRLHKPVKMEFLVRYKLVFLGVVMGAIAGYAYYHFIGCISGTCPITSQPLNSTLYGALMGGVLFIGNKKEKAEKIKTDEQD